MLKTSMTHQILPILLVFVLKFATASYCPTCDPKNPPYFQETEAYLDCVFERDTDNANKVVYDWQVALPNDHIWSGQKEGHDGKALASNIKANCKGTVRGGDDGGGGSSPLEKFEAFPVDEMGTVDVSFRTDETCGVLNVQKAVFDTMKGLVEVQCKRMPPGAGDSMVISDL